MGVPAFFGAISSGVAWYKCGNEIDDPANGEYHGGATKMIADSGARDKHDDSWKQAKSFSFWSIFAFVSLLAGALLSIASPVGGFVVGTLLCTIFLVLGGYYAWGEQIGEQIGVLFQSLTVMLKVCVPCVGGDEDEDEVIGRRRLPAVEPNQSQESELPVMTLALVVLLLGAACYAVRRARQKQEAAMFRADGVTLRV